MQSLVDRYLKGEVDLGDVSPRVNALFSNPAFWESGLKEFPIRDVDNDAERARLKLLLQAMMKGAEERLDGLPPFIEYLPVEDPPEEK